AAKMYGWNGSLASLPADCTGIPTTLFCVSTGNTDANPDDWLNPMIAGTWSSLISDFTWLSSVDGLYWSSFSIRLICLLFTPPLPLAYLMYASSPCSAGTCELAVGPLLSPTQPMSIAVPAVGRAEAAATIAIAVMRPTTSATVTRVVIAASP